MSNPQEEANKLVYRMLSSMMPHRFDKDDAKQCALIAVEEVIKQLHKSDKGYTLVDDIIYWNEVKAEIEKL